MSLHRKIALSLLAGLALPGATVPAAAQNLTIEALQGMTINATLRYRGTFANMLGEAPGIITYNYRLRIIGDVVQADQSRSVEALTSQGRGQGSGSHSFSGRIGRPGQSSFGDYLWQLSGNNLSVLNPSQIGGFQLAVGFFADSRGVLCRVAAPYIRDPGAVSNVSQLAFGGQVVIVNMQQIDAACTVSRT